MTARDDRPPAPGGGPRLTWRSGGWVLALSVLVSAAFLLLKVVGAGTWSGGVQGDGRDPATYGFDLSGFTLPRDALAAGHLHREHLQALDRPWTVPGSQVLAINEAHRGKFLVTDDRVIGVEIGGEARAYPVRILEWHEVVNDVLGGVPIAVTWSPLTDSAVVFDRRPVGAAEGVDGPREDDPARTFAVSGLIWSSNLLTFDRETESLWCQLTRRAVSGPAAEAGLGLRMIPAALVPWGTWLERRPGTTVIRGRPELRKRYNEDPYGNYRVRGRLRFPLPGEAEPGADAFDPVVAVASADAWSVHRAGAADAPEHLRGDPRAGTAWSAAEPPVPLIPALRFAWRAAAPHAAPPPR